MDFGKVEPEELDNVNFKLPEDHPGTTSVLKNNATGKTLVRMGCAKWGRKDWIGKIYPPKTKEADFLTHYAKHFNCIELNASFYKTPTITQVKAWKGKVGKDFKFFPKFSQQISHIKRLKDAEAATNDFLKNISAFDETLGPIFLQLPPNFAPKNFEVLEAYVKSLPTDLDVFVELRHPLWFEDKDIFNRITEVLEKAGKGLLITDASGRRDCVHMRLTTSEAFIRFVGNGLHPTDYTRVDDWVQRIKSWMDQGIQTVDFFMHQHEEIHSPELSKYVIEQLNKHCGTSIPELVFLDGKNPMGF